MVEQDLLQALKKLRLHWSALDSFVRSLVGDGLPLEPTDAAQLALAARVMRDDFSENGCRHVGEVVANTMRELRERANVN